MKKGKRVQKKIPELGEDELWEAVWVFISICANYQASRSNKRPKPPTMNPAIKAVLKHYRSSYKLGQSKRFAQSYLFRVGRPRLAKIYSKWKKEKWTKEKVRSECSILLKDLNEKFACMVGSYGDDSEIRLLFPDPRFVSRIEERLSEKNETAIVASLIPSSDGVLRGEVTPERRALANLKLAFELPDEKTLLNNIRKNKWGGPFYSRPSLRFLFSPTEHDYKIDEICQKIGIPREKP